MIVVAIVHVTIDICLLSIVFFLTETYALCRFQLTALLINRN